MPKGRTFSPFEVLLFTASFGVSLRLVIPALKSYSATNELPDHEQIWQAVQAAWQDLHSGEKGEFVKGRNGNAAANDFKRVVSHALMYEIGLPCNLVTSAMGGKSHNGAYIAARRHADIAELEHEGEYRELYAKVAGFLRNQFFGI